MCRTFFAVSGVTGLLLRYAYELQIGSRTGLYLPRNLPIFLYIPLYLPTSPDAYDLRIGSLSWSPYISLYLPISPYISLCLPMSPYISLCQGVITRLQREVLLPISQLLFPVQVTRYHPYVR